MEILSPEKVRHTRQINEATSYGLTLVIGLPLPDVINAQVQQVQEALEKLVPGRFIWYAPYHRHLTVVAPLRGRYREYPPLQRHELPDNLVEFIQSLNECCYRLSWLTLIPEKILLRDNGMVSVQFLGNVPLKEEITRCLNTFPTLDTPKHNSNLWLHHTTGYLKSSLTPDEQEKVQAFLDEVRWQGEMAVQQVWLVHYAIRTLQQIKGKIPFRLHETNAVTEEQFLKELQIFKG